MQKIRHDRNFGRNLRSLRTKNHLTQDQVVAKLQLSGCALSRNVYSRYETGELNIRIDEIVALKSIFNCEFADFFSGLD